VICESMFNLFSFLILPLSWLPAIPAGICVPDLTILLFLVSLLHEHIQWRASGFALCRPRCSQCIHYVDQLDNWRGDLGAGVARSGCADQKSVYQVWDVSPWPESTRTGRFCSSRDACVDSSIQILVNRSCARVRGDCHSHDCGIWRT